MDIATAVKSGRVTSDGTVFVITLDGERRVGQYQAGTPTEGLEFFARKYVDLIVEADVMLTRLRENRGVPGPAKVLAEKLRSTYVEPNVVGDLSILLKKADELIAAAAERAVVLTEQKKEQREQTLAKRREIAETAKTLANSTSWKKTTEKFASMLATWKELPRFDRKVEQELWKVFSHARSTFDKRKRTHFAEQTKLRTSAATLKREIVEKAESIKDSSNWVETAKKFKELMDKWKTAGRIGKGEDEALWVRFKAAHDHFFTRKNEDLAKRKVSQESNLEKKRNLLAEAEALLPITNLEAAKKALRDILQRWDRVGHIPKDAIKKLEERLKIVKDAVSDAVARENSRKDPDKHARANSTISLFAEKIAKLEADLAKAQASGNTAKVTSLNNAISSQRMLMQAAEEALSDFVR
ncbi:MAG: DUF349 domain-containing protein [Actinobacteria bacterium]|nr:DUF349 domain-containing protein [Actinomycetota bacterium]